MSKDDMLVPSILDRMARMLRREIQDSVLSAERAGWRNEGTIRMDKGGMLAPSMRGRMAPMLRGNNHYVSNAKKVGWRNKGRTRMGKGSVLAPSTRGRTTPPAYLMRHCAWCVWKRGTESQGTAEMRMVGRRVACMLSKAVRLMMAACSACAPLAWRRT
jgi:hypothetical protein